MNKQFRQLAELPDDEASLSSLCGEAAALRDEHFGNVLTYSPKVFIPLTELCRDVCHYCTYAKTPRRMAQAYLSPERTLEIARAGRDAGCREALFTLGDKPELRYRSARDALAELGHGTTLEYLAAMALMVRRETGLLPHLNPGVMELDDIEKLRQVAPSMGIMLETSSNRLSQRGGPHFGSPDKAPERRLATIAAAGAANVPMTSGILIGIGETRLERIESLLALRELHMQFGHIQEIIVQNFVPKPGTKMADQPAASEHELRWSIAAARLIFGPEMSIQAPPNLSPGRLAGLIDAGINDFGGVSPVTPDHVNPESPWPALDRLREAAARQGKALTPRLTVYPDYIAARDRWIDPALHGTVLQHADACGLAREDSWSAGTSTQVPPLPNGSPRRGNNLATVLDHAASGSDLDEDQVTQLFAVRGDELQAVLSAADELRRHVCGDTVTYAVNRNINYTNICSFQCRFCAFSKGTGHADLRGKPYVIDLDEISRRTAEAWARGATEICLQGGIHPDFTGRTYVEICRAVKQAAPNIHVHAFSALEVTHGAQTCGQSIPKFLEQLQAAGLGSLPGTAAEILDDEVRQRICPDKLNTREWLGVIGAAHQVGLPTTSTMMFGHLESPRHWARHLLLLRDQQRLTGGITEFVPLPFVHNEAPMFRRGQSRPGPTFREAVLMHAVARLTLHPVIQNIQTSWVKLGRDGTQACLEAGANDLGGSLMNESISRAAGASHGQEFPPQEMQDFILGLGRDARQRTTLYADVPTERIAAAAQAGPLESPRLQMAEQLLYRRRDSAAQVNP